MVSAGVLLYYVRVIENLLRLLTAARGPKATDHILMTACRFRGEADIERSLARTKSVANVKGFG
jgi:hypothetical protein